MTSSLSSILPAPRYQFEDDDDDEVAPSSSSSSSNAAFQPPPYGKRQGFVPRTIQDYGDGGAFPEIHTLQYPLDMGRADSSSSTAVVPLQADSSGSLNFDAIVRQGARKEMIIHSGYDAMIEKNASAFDLARPSSEEEESVAERTRKALGQLVDRKIATAMPTHVAKQSKEAVFIKYTPADQNAAFNSGAQQRVIRLQAMPLDPLQPPKFAHKKVPGGPPSPPPPVLHSPPRKITKEDQAAWKIPPCLSTDHQLLTNRGFIGVDDVHAYLKTSSDSTPLRLACYDVASASILYRPLSPSQLIDRNYDANREGDMIYFSHQANQSNIVDLLVTPDHQMYARLASSSDDSALQRSDDNRSDEYCKFPAKSLANHHNAVIQFKSSAHNGIASDKSIVHDAISPIMNQLDLANHSQFTAFLEFYGYWLGQAIRFTDNDKHIRISPRSDQHLVTIHEWFDQLGFMRDVDYHDANAAIGPVEYHITRPSWLAFLSSTHSNKHDQSIERHTAGDYMDLFTYTPSLPEHPAVRPGTTSHSHATLPEITHQHIDIVINDVTLPSTPSLVNNKDVANQSAEVLAPWVWSLSKEYIRAVFNGLQLADGSQSTDCNSIITSSVQFRDALMVLALHAGYSAHFESHSPAANTDECTAWRVFYTDDAESDPVLYGDRHIKRSSSVKRVWCINVDHPDHLIITRRVMEIQGDIITKASTPIIIGNCISNWKNIKGYTIPLDKRLAADGRGLQEVQVNDKFAKLSESLFLAERSARDEIEQRASIMKKLQKKQKEQKEEELRQLAAQARQTAHADEREIESYESTQRAPEGAPHSYDDTSEGEETGNPQQRALRDQLRREREQEIKRDLRMQNKKAEKSSSFAARDRERDVSEKIALGQLTGANKDAQFDQRLFNQDAGMASGFGADDSYNVYDKALFSGSSANVSYRPKPIEGYEESSDRGTAKFKADKGFSGTEGGSDGPRSRPVEFERDNADDPYGLNALLTTQKRSGALDHIGQRGAHGIGGGGHDSDAKSGTVHPSRMAFVPATQSTNASTDSSRRNERRRSRSGSRSRSRSRDRDGKRRRY